MFVRARPKVTCGHVVLELSVYPAISWPAEDRRRNPAVRIVSNMSSRNPKRGPTLTVVDDNAATRAAEEPPAHELDWSIYMARAQGGDRQAYHRLLEDIAPYVRALAARRLLNHSDVEDAVQDVLLTVHAIRHTYDPARPFGPWLVAIANRRIVDWLRREGRAIARDVEFDPDDETFSPLQPNIVEEASDERALRNAIDQLPPGQGKAIRLTKLEELSLKEAAAKSGMSIASLKVATHRALKNLRKHFAQRNNK
jgi:RNA polymerase sigma factor (sigma-70 family)